MRRSPYKRIVLGGYIMTNLSIILKKKLNSIIKSMEVNKELYLKDPRVHFIRKRKLTFSNLISFVLTIGASSLNKELLSNTYTKKKTITSSALIQQRDKLTPATFEMLFKNFNMHIPQKKVFKGYRLFAVDGSDVNTPYNPKDSRTFIKPPGNIRGFNQIHLNAAYDIINEIYVDVRIQEKCNHNEHKAFVDMIKNFPIKEKSLFILDRGYEAYNNFATVIESGHKFLIRAKDIDSNGILSSMSSKLPKADEFTTTINFKITRQQTNEIKENKEKYKFLPDNCNFDFLPPGSKGLYDMEIRVVRVHTEEGKYISLITNLSEDEFSIEEIREIYNMRWGIETSFRNLKYSLGLVYFHSKKIDFIVQEVYSKLIMYNFTSAVSNSVNIIQNKKHQYKVNFSTAIYAVIDFVKSNKVNPIEQLIIRYLTPIRKNRKYKRNIRTQSAVPFNYRA